MQVFGGPVEAGAGGVAQHVSAVVALGKAQLLVVARQALTQQARGEAAALVATAAGVDKKSRLAAGGDCLADFAPVGQLGGQRFG